MSFALPVEYIKETDSLLTLHHPRPTYPFHVLLVPKRQIGSLDDSGYRLVVNGGKNKELGILHFHLISDKEINNTD